MRTLLAIVVAVGLTACNGCQPSPAPPPATPVSPTTIYNELVEAGCFAPTDAGPNDVARELALPSPPSWVTCMADGGSVQTCAAVPCTPAR
jgi:hypothetical protein